MFNAALNREQTKEKMLHSEISALGHEWATLQDNHEQYEKYSLLIKLGSIALFVACLALTLDAAITAFLLLILWMQEGIYRTSQSRLGVRILRVEQLLRQGSPQAGYQLHSEWQTSRPGVAGLLAEYGKSMLRPTVAFPYVVLMAMDIGWSLIG